MRYLFSRVDVMLYMSDYLTDIQCKGLRPLFYTERLNRVLTDTPNDIYMDNLNSPHDRHKYS